MPKYEHVMIARQDLSNMQAEGLLEHFSKILIENKGNVDVNLSPVLDLPIGWEQNTILEEISLSWTESKNLMISVSAGENARSGDIRFVVYADGENWFESVNVDVIQLADPYLTFASLEIEGETWDHPFGPGQHPSGIALNYTWLIGNYADTFWNPAVTISLDNGLLGECNQVGIVSKDEIQPLTCTVIISATADPFSEPEFSVILEGDLVRHEENVTMLVAPNNEVSWKIDGPEIIQVEESSVIQITVTNIGNSLISNRVEAIPPSGWITSFDGTDTISLEPGESEKLRLMVTAKESGEGTLSLSLFEGEEINGNSVEITMKSEGEIITEESSNLSSVFLSITGIIFLVGVGVILLQIGKKKEEKISKLPASAPSSQVFTQNSEEIPCWSCHQPILSMMQGCAKCGARYHSVCNVPSCINCGEDSENFVNVR